MRVKPTISYLWDGGGALPIRSHEHQFAHTRIAAWRMNIVSVHSALANSLSPPPPSPHIHKHLLNPPPPSAARVGRTRNREHDLCSIVWQRDVPISVAISALQRLPSALRPQSLAQAQPSHVHDTTRIVEACLSPCSRSGASHVGCIAVHTRSGQRWSGQ